MVIQTATATLLVVTYMYGTVLNGITLVLFKVPKVIKVQTEHLVFQV